MEFSRQDTGPVCFGLGRCFFLYRSHTERPHSQKSGLISSNCSWINNTCTFEKSKLNNFKVTYNKCRCNKFTVTVYLIMTYNVLHNNFELTYDKCTCNECTARVCLIIDHVHYIQLLGVGSSCAAPVVLFPTPQPAGQAMNIYIYIYI